MNMKSCKLKKFCLYIFFSLLFASCSDSIDSILSDYNSDFDTEVSVKKSGSSLSPGDDGFCADEMLKETYFVSRTATLNLYGPKNCSSYKWKLLQIEQVTELNLTYSVERAVSYSLSNGSTEASRAFILYIPTSGLERGTYKLTLAVTDKEGNEYSDNCRIVVYQL